jgi:hypothetical protein
MHPLLVQVAPTMTQTAQLNTPISPWLIGMAIFVVVALVPLFKKIGGKIPGLEGQAERDTNSPWDGRITVFGLTMAFVFVVGFVLDSWGIRPASNQANSPTPVPTISPASSAECTRQADRREVIIFADQQFGGECLPADNTAYYSPTPPHRWSGWAIRYSAAGSIKVGADVRAVLCADELWTDCIFVSRDEPQLPVVAPDLVRHGATRITLRSWIVLSKDTHWDQCPIGIGQVAVFSSPNFEGECRVFSASSQAQSILEQTRTWKPSSIRVGRHTKASLCTRIEPNQCSTELTHLWADLGSFHANISGSWAGQAEWVRVVQW